MTEEKQRDVPLNELDFNSQLSNPLWGQDISNTELKEKLSYLKIKIDEHGQPLFSVNETEKDGKKVVVYMPELESVSEYETLSFITRDFRLGNLSKFNKELEYCEHWAKLAHDCLQLGFKKAHSAALARVALRLELSQSVGGFFRKIMNTFRQESFSTNMEPPKKSLFGGKKQQQNTGGGY